MRISTNTYFLVFQLNDSRINKKFRIHLKSDKHLTTLPEFWIAIFIPIGIAILITIVIVINSDLTLDLSYSGFNSTIVVFKVPLSIAALSFPFVALVATNHRSRQSSKQIQLATDQNNFANYFKHKEEFIKLLEKLETKWNINFYEPDILYEDLFPNNSIQNLQTSSTSSEGKDSILVSIINHYSELCESSSIRNEDEDEVQQFYFDLFLLSATQLKFKVNNGRSLPFGDQYQKQYEIAYDVDNQLKHSVITYKVIKELAHFTEIKDKLPISRAVESVEFMGTVSRLFYNTETY